MKTVRLMTCESSVEASLIKGRLENEGVKCFLTNENFSNLMPNFNQIMGSGVQIMIDEADLNRAVEILELNKREELICPECGSHNIKTVLGKSSFTKIIIVILSLFSTTPINNIKGVNRCRDCKKEF
ncbi:MAG: DUF2007 domain-containing protein [Bacteroidales bacterium]|nr:DUF2007 domain-containing protein [Bacteroidales bacterium]